MVVNLVNGEGGQRGKVVDYLSDNLPPRLTVPGKFHFDRNRQARLAHEEKIKESGVGQVDLPSYESKWLVSRGSQQIWARGQDIFQLFLRRKGRQLGCDLP